MTHTCASQPAMMISRVPAGISPSKPGAVDAENAVFSSVALG